MFTLPKEDNYLGVEVPPRSSLAVSDGYWIMLKPLSEGTHTIDIYGKAVFSDKPADFFETGVTYTIIVKSKRW